MKIPRMDLSRSPELELLLASSRWPQRPEDLESIRALAAQPLDWQAFLLLVQHHRLVPLVAHNLRAALHLSSASADTSPERRDLLDELQRLAAANTYRAFRSLAELRRLVQEFEAQGIPVRVIKGLPLAQAVFGNLGMRATGDIDLLIDENSILQADQVLRGFGYRGLFQVDRFSSRRLAFYHAHWKDIAYESSAGFEVDLHWRGFRNREMPGTALCATPGREIVSFGQFQVSTLPPMESLLYLCVHGTLDGWLYLKSLADVAAQVRAMTAPHLDAVAALASDYGVLPELSATLILVRRYLTLDHWSSRLLPETHPIVAHILRFATRSLTEGGFLAGRQGMPASSVAAFELGLRPNLRYRTELLVRILFRARMWETVPLPDLLFGLYPLLSPIEWVYFRMRSRFEKPPTRTALSV